MVGLCVVAAGRATRLIFCRWSLNTRNAGAPDRQGYIAVMLLARVLDRCYAVDKLGLARRDFVITLPHLYSVATAHYCRMHRNVHT
jgi:hypothetical protein